MRHRTAARPSSGYLLSVEELIHADIFADFVEMDEYLLSQGYKDPAAVVIGSTLEEHLRRLASKNKITPIVAGKSKKADQLNAELAGHLAYSKPSLRTLASGNFQLLQLLSHRQVIHRITTVDCSQFTHFCSQALGRLNELHIIFQEEFTCPKVAVAEIER